MKSFKEFLKEEKLSKAWVRFSRGDRGSKQIIGELIDYVKPYPHVKDVMSSTEPVTNSVHWMLNQWRSKFGVHEFTLLDNQYKEVKTGSLSMSEVVEMMIDK